MHPIRTIRPYVQAIPNFLIYQIVTGGISSAAFALANYLAGWTLALSGRSAVTTGDFTFLFTTWQGLLLLVIALAALYVSFALGIVLIITFSDNWIDGKDCSIRETLSQTALNLKGFANPWGVLVILYVSLLNPFVGVGVTSQLTENWHIPAFVSSVINESLALHSAYLLVLATFVMLNLLLSFTIHGIVIDHMGVPDACRQSVRLMKGNWKNYLVGMVGFLAASIAIGAVLTIIVMVGGALLFQLMNGLGSERFRLLLYNSCAIVFFVLLVSLAAPLSMLRSTELYKSYVQGETVRAPIHKMHLHPVLWVISVLIVLGMGLFSFAGNTFFDEFFPLGSEVSVVAHRAGGTEDVENTATALDTAVDAGAWGAEIDIQRTADGYYIVNHDDTFSRLCGDNHRPDQLTLEEIRELQVKNTSRSGKPEQPVSTYEEMLEGSRDRLVLFVELKGKTADRRMADDAVRIAKEMGMLDQCVFISLKYDLVDYLEQTYPEAETGFLAFASYGNIAELHCDYLALEEQAATDSAIHAVHAMDKKAIVWTVNSRDSQYHFLLSDADAIITDKISQAQDLREQLLKRSDEERITDTMVDLI